MCLILPESINIVTPKFQAAFAVWITGLPSSGKSTITVFVRAQLAERGVDVAVLESDELRKVLTPHPRYDAEERDLFYRQMVYIGTLLTNHGVPVIFDATANRRAYRDLARQQILRFLEIYVDCPVETCIARDPKGIYKQAQQRQAATVPGIQAPYEPPDHPDLVVKGEGENPEMEADRVIAKLIEKGYLEACATCTSS